MKTTLYRFSPSSSKWFNAASDRYKNDGTHAAVKMMITKDDKDRLNALEWTSVEWKRMKPEQAGVLLDHGVKRPEKLNDLTADEIKSLVDGIILKVEEEEEIAEDDEEEGESVELSSVSSSSVEDEIVASTTPQNDDSEYHEIILINADASETHKGVYKNPAEADMVLDLFIRKGKTAIKRQIPPPS